MASRKNIWDALDKMEGGVPGTSHANLNKERVRQGYKPEKSSKSKALASKGGKKEGHGQWLTQQIKKDNPAYYAVDRRANRARKTGK